STHNTTVATDSRSSNSRWIELRSESGFMVRVRNENAGSSFQTRAARTTEGFSKKPDFYAAAGAASGSARRVLRRRIAPQMPFRIPRKAFICRENPAG
ncbi:MAG: hypothetical protein ACR2P6_10025, partial [Gammaproteobacteria bacterium]